MQAAQLSHPVAGEGGKIAALEGLRGFAAMQVVLLHYISAFLPSTQMVGPPLTGWEHLLIRSPLTVLVEGHVAVYIFFVLSGAVLTLAFAQTRIGWPANLLRRLVRLGVPMAGAVLLGFLLRSLWPRSHIEAAALSHSSWLQNLFEMPMTPRHLLREILCNGMICGYGFDGETWPPGGNFVSLQSVNHAFDPPLWTLHYELYGSAVVLALTTLRRHGRRLYLAGLIAAVPLLAGNMMLPFFLGHLLAPVAAHGLARPRRARLGLAGSFLLLALGATLSARRDWAGVEMLRDLLEHSTLIPLSWKLQFQSEVAGMLIATGVFLNPWLRDWLGRRPIAYLGRLSFSIYLVHFPLLMTVIPWVYAHIAGPLGPSLGFFAVLVLGLALTMPLAALFDRPAVQLSRRLANALQGIFPQRLPPLKSPA